MKVLQFNVPLSKSNGTIQNPPPEYQYPIKSSSVKYRNGGIGNDWCVFACNPNSETGLTPIQAQKAFFRISDDVKSAPEIRITGFGVDDMPRGSSGRRNQYSQTQQTHFGKFLHAKGTGLDYTVDTTGGNSGSPVINNKASVKLSIGVHTHGGCRPPTSGNHGTSFINGDFKKAVGNLLNGTTFFVDQLHPKASTGNGTILEPFNTISKAIENASSDSIIHIVTGSYNESIAISKPVKINVSTGPVVIGKYESGKQMVLENIALNSSKTYQADHIVIGENFAVNSGAEVILQAKSVTIKSNLTIAQGAIFQINLNQKFSALGTQHEVRGIGSTKAVAERVATRKAQNIANGSPFAVVSTDFIPQTNGWLCIMVIDVN